MNHTRHCTLDKIPTCVVSALQVQKNEVPQVAAAIQELNEDDADRIPIVYMVVQKMHHTRFFPIDRNMDCSGNCLPGARSCPTVGQHRSGPRVFEHYANKRNLVFIREATHACRGSGMQCI